MDPHVRHVVLIAPDPDHPIGPDLGDLHVGQLGSGQNGPFRVEYEPPGEGALAGEGTAVLHPDVVRAVTGGDWHQAGAEIA